MIYEIGALAELDVIFTDPTGVLTDPAAVTLTIEQPDATVVHVPSGSIAHDSTGVYHYNLTLAQAGVYTFRYTGSGGLTAVQESSSITVRASRIGAPNIDLTDLSSVKAWESSSGTPSPNTTDDDNILRCITAASLEWLRRTGRGAEDGLVPATSPFITPVAYDEWRDGNGNDRLFLQQWPIRTVTLLSVCGVGIPASTSWNQPGYVIDQNKKSLVLRSGAAAQSYGYRSMRFGGSVYYFARGTQNIEVQYTAGFDGVPPDVELAVREMVAVNHRRREWIDQKSKAMAQGAGTVTYRDWEIPPHVLAVMRSYQRTAIL